MSLESIVPDGWKRPRGYSYAIKAGDRLQVAGLLAHDPASQELVGAGDFAAQWGRIWQNLAAVLAAAGAAPADVTTLRIFVTSLDAYTSALSNLGRPWREVFDDHLPAITMVEVSALVDPSALIEVEAEAIVAGGA